MKPKEQQQFVCLLADLLENGFSLQEAFGFMEKAQVVPPEILAICQTNLLAGTSLSKSFAALGFSSQQVLQLQLADLHGNLETTLRNIDRQLVLFMEQRKNFRKIVSYPILLFLTIFAVVVAIDYYLLPQLLASGFITEERWTIRLLLWLPKGLGGILALGFLLLLVGRNAFKQKSAIQQAELLAKLPIIGQWYCWYISAHFALEWGKLFQEGLELRQIIDNLANSQGSSLMQELALAMNRGLQTGESLVHQLEKFSFLSTEFYLIIQQGEIKGKLGEELLLYSELLWQRFFDRLEKLLRWIQPVAFLVVALVIILIYGAMLLPMYQNIEGMI